MKDYRQAGWSETEPVPSRHWDEETRLVERAKRGDKKAIGELYGSHVDLIYRYVSSRVRDKTVAEDLTAQVFLCMLEGLPHYECRGKPFVSWLYRIACARTVDYWRQQQRFPHEVLDEALPADLSRPDEYMEAEGEWITAIDLLAQLTDDQQEVLILRFIGEMSLSQVAEILGKTVGATKALQHRALSTLSRLCQSQGRSNRDE